MKLQKKSFFITKVLLVINLYVIVGIMGKKIKNTATETLSRQYIG